MPTKDKDVRKGCSARWRKNNPESARITHLRGRAKKLGVPFDITKHDIVIPDRCPILDIPLFFTDGQRTSNTPSIDRIDNSKGYTKDNVRVISFKANRSKGNMTLADAERLVAYMKGE